MRFVAKMDRGRADMWSSDEIDGTPYVLRAKDYDDAVRICRERGMIYCHPLTDEPKANGHDKDAA